MASVLVEFGALVTLEEIHQSSPFFKEGVSLRVTGTLNEYSVKTAIAIVADGDVVLRIDTQYLRDLGFCARSVYQFVGELNIQPNNEAVLRARVGRNIDGIDLKLYHQSIQLLRQSLKEYQDTFDVVS